MKITKSCVQIRMESLKLRTKPGIAKLIGILICMSGVSSLAFYKGPHFKLLRHLLNPKHPHHLSSGKSWIKGVFIMLLSNFFWGLFLVSQVPFLLRQKIN